MKLVAFTRSDVTKRIEVEAEPNSAGWDALMAKIPEGDQLILVRAER